MVRSALAGSLLPALLVSWTLVGCSGRGPGSPEKLPSKVQKPVSVMTVAVQSDDVRRTTTQPATVRAFYEASIQPRIGGYISGVHADIGDFVKEGAALATIDVPEMKEQRAVLAAQIEKAKAEEERSRAGIALAKAGVQAANARLDEARSELQSVEASLAAAEAEFVRTNDLVERKSLEPRVLDEVRKKRDSEIARKAALTSAVDSADAAVNVAKAQQVSTEADLQAAEADTRISEQRLKELDELLKFASVTAPFAGVVTRRTAEPGNLVGASGTGKPLFVLSRIDRVRVQISVPERDAAFVAVGDEVNLTFPSFSAEQDLKAEVTRTATSLDPSTRMMLVEAEVDNKDGRFLPGMFGQAIVSLGTNVAAPVLPARAVRFTDAGKAFVYVLKDDTVSIVDVTTGEDDGSVIEIVSGVEPGQAVIDAHLQRFTEGQQVNVLN